MAAIETSPFCAAVDWGTSSFRLWLLAEDGAILGERRSREGMQVAATTGFAGILEQHLTLAAAAPDLPVMICGMAGARQGWVEAPYVDTPASVADIAGGAVRIPGVTRDVRILPGVAERALEHPDVMRGEETIIMGLVRGLPPSDADSLVCLPGTHSKWVAVRKAQITGFSTFMTGEMFALLSGQSVLRHAVDADADVSAEMPAFRSGVEAGLSAPALLSRTLFSLRAASLFGRGTPQSAGAYLSGLLLGFELAGARLAYAQARHVLLAASGPLLTLYAEALPIAGFAPEIVDADAAVRAGLLAASHACFPSDEGSRS